MKTDNTTNEFEIELTSSDEQENKNASGGEVLLVKRADIENVNDLVTIVNNNQKPVQLLVFDFKIEYSHGPDGDRKDLPLDVSTIHVTGKKAPFDLKRTSVVEQWPSSGFHDHRERSFFDLILNPVITLNPKESICLSWTPQQERSTRFLAKIVYKKM